MRIILLSQEHFDDVASRIEAHNRVIGNLPTPTLIVPLLDTVYMVAEKVDVRYRQGPAFEAFLGGSPVSLAAINKFDEVERG